jgi:GNAT superfamily N-acetyltransferase
VKDYDAQPGHHPLDWPRRFDVSHWWFAAACLNEQRIGGAVVIPGSSASPDTAIVWDLRIAPAFRRRDVGRAILAFAESQARSRGHRHIQIETQDINVPACRFYARAGYRLSEINARAYADLPDEVRLIWHNDL